MHCEAFLSFLLLSYSSMDSLSVVQATVLPPNPRNLTGGHSQHQHQADPPTKLLSRLFPQGGGKDRYHSRNNNQNRYKQPENPVEFRSFPGRSSHSPSSPSPRHQQHQHDRNQYQPRAHLAWYEQMRRRQRMVSCRKVEKVVQVEECEPYTVKTCWTEAKQECLFQPVRNCTGVVRTQAQQVCYDVEDTVCALVESVALHQVEEMYQEQECIFDKEDVTCGTTSGLDRFDKYDYKCGNVNTLNCYQEEQFVYDTKCVETVKFNCYKQLNPETYHPMTVCTPEPKHNCYKAHRKVSAEVCKTEPERYCESFNNFIYYPVEKESCKKKTRKTCDFKLKKIPKVVKEFTYDLDCKKNPVHICEHVEISTLEPECVETEVLSCKYIPHEQCKHDPAQYCHVVDKVVLEDVCD